MWQRRSLSDSRQECTRKYTGCARFMHDERKSYGGKVIFVCHSDRKSGGHHLPGGENLKEVDLIAAEDTRNSIRLLNHFEIRTPMTSYHEYNKIEKAYRLVDKMREGLDIALITDAGTPGISDPGKTSCASAMRKGLR